MNYSKQTLITIVLLSVIFLSSVTAISQDINNKLVFSEVYLDKENPTNNWIEVYNPTADTLVFKGYRTSNVYSINVIPKCVNPDSSLRLNPGECIVICSELERFHNIWGKEIKAFESAPLRFLIEGGFIILRTKGNNDSVIDGFRYGDSSFSRGVIDALGTNVLDFTSNGRSHSRSFELSEDRKRARGFTKSQPTPGVHNN